MRHCYRRGIQRVAQALFNLEVPMIAAINEHAMGAGLDLACLCDIQVASDKAKTLMAISNSPTPLCLPRHKNSRPNTTHAIPSHTSQATEHRTAPLPNMHRPASSKLSFEP